jgi:hypothetical protein
MFAFARGSVPVFDVSRAVMTSRHGKQYATMDRQSQGDFCTGLCEILHGILRKPAASVDTTMNGFIIKEVRKSG